jgi:predicted ATPase/DNA-binding XRE family transcriptional regulator
MSAHPLFSFGTWLRWQRQVRDWTQDNLAIQVNCTVGSIRRFERDQGPPSRQLAELIADCFAIPQAERAAFVRWARRVPNTEPPPSVLSSYDPGTAASPGGLAASPDIPASPTRLIGREADIARIRALLKHEDVHLLTLTGAGGSGKTRLALAVAQEWATDFPGSVIFVSLAATRGIELAQQMITQVAEATAALPLSAQAHRLLVLDNLEHVLAAATTVGQLLERDPQLKIIVTSRVVLHIYGEHEFDVQPLAVPDFPSLLTVQELEQVAAVRVFIQRAQAVRADFTLTEENAAAVAAICRHMDGLPLALELAAARIKTFTPQALLERLGDRFTLLTGGPRNVLARQQTLRSAITWSYDLLEPEEQQLFARLAVFAGRFAFDAAQSICVPEEDHEQALLDRLLVLVDKSLLRQSEGVNGELRLWMLETIREYAWLRLSEMGETELLQRRHADYYLRLLEELRAQPFDQDIDVQWFSVEKANLYAVYSWAVRQDHPEVVTAIGLALWELGVGSHLEGASAAGWDPLL